MNYTELFNDIKRGNIGNLYLFYGQEEYVKEQALSQIISKVVGQSFRELNYHILDGNEIDMEDIQNACETLPFMVPRKLIVVKDFVSLGSRKTTVHEDALVDYLKRIPDTACLVFYNHGDVDKTKRVYKTLNKVGKVIEFSWLKEPDLKKWIAASLRRQGKEMTIRDMEHFISIVGTNLEDINNELLKLTAYTGDRKQIDRGALDTVVIPNIEHTIFQMVEAVGDKNSSKALELFNQLIFQGQATLAILSMIARQLRIIMQCKDYSNRGYSQKAIGEKTGLKTFVINKGIKQGKNFTIDQLGNGIMLCAKLDNDIKNGRVNDRLGVEILIMKMCTIQ